MKIGIVGCAGRMGRTLIQHIFDTPGAELGGGTEPSGPAVGQDLGALVGVSPVGVTVGTDTAALFKASDCVIDFTVAAVAARHAELAAETGKSLVLGTTGLNAAAKEAVVNAAKSVCVVHASNFSVGVNVLFALTEKLASTLGPDYDIDILEMHHRHKVDAPSGTALSLGEAAAAGRKVDLQKVGKWTREGQVGARPVGEIGFATLRGGDVVGDHTVMFAAMGERLELTHKASDRGVFARGSLRAAQWLVGRKAGLYDMQDVLGLQ